MASCPHSMDESADCFCPATMLLRLQSCLTARKHLQERISSLEYNLNHKKSLLEKHKFDARTYDDALKKCIEDRAALEAKCASLENELMILTMPWEELAKTEASTFANESKRLRHVKLEKKLGQTDVSMSTEQLKNSNKEKEMIASAGIQLDNLMENTRKLAVDFASFKNRVRKHGYQSEELKKSSNSL